MLFYLDAFFDSNYLQEMAHYAADLKAKKASIFWLEAMTSYFQILSSCSIEKKQKNNPGVDLMILLR